MPIFGARAFVNAPSRTARLLVSVAAICIAPVWAAGAAGAACPDGIGVARTVEIDTSGGPLFGVITKQVHEKSFLAPKEVVLTFDDGPMPGVTKSILDTLDRHCTKATFFSVGQMAIAYPELVQEVIQRGHTLGTHTWSHPMNLRRLKGEQAREQIELGFAAVTLAAGKPIAPFFRFPGLNDSPSLLEHLERRDIAAFSVDVVSNDSYIADPGRLIDRTLAQAEAEHGGIMLFHDIKPQTARALPAILTELKARGFMVVHMRAKAPFKSDTHYTAALQDRLTAKHPAAKRKLLAITDAAASQPTLAAVHVAVEQRPVTAPEPAAPAPRPALATSPSVPPALPAPEDRASIAAPAAGPNQSSTETVSKPAEPASRPLFRGQPRIINAEPVPSAASPVAPPSVPEKAKMTAAAPLAPNVPVGAQASGVQVSGAQTKSAPDKGAAAPKAAVSSQANVPAGVEVIAGSYPQNMPAEAPAKDLEAGRFAAPEIVAGTYRRPAPAAASTEKQDSSTAAGSRNWIDTFKARNRDGS